MHASVVMVRVSPVPSGGVSSLLKLSRGPISPCSWMFRFLSQSQQEKPGRSSLRENQRSGTVFESREKSAQTCWEHWSSCRCPGSLNGELSLEPSHVHLEAGKM